MTLSKALPHASSCEETQIYRPESELRPDWLRPRTQSSDSDRNTDRKTPKNQSPQTSCPAKEPRTRETRTGLQSAGLANHQNHKNTKLFARTKTQGHQIDPENDPSTDPLSTQSSSQFPNQISSQLPRKNLELWPQKELLASPQARRPLTRLLRIHPLPK